MTKATLVLGGHVNGYNVIRELHYYGIREIVLFDYGDSIARSSNKIIKYRGIDRTKESLLNNLISLKKDYDRILIIPTNDLELEFLSELYDQIKDFCLLPFNEKNIHESLKKQFQYQICEKEQIPFPRSIIISLSEDFDTINDLVFPVIIKPTKRDDISNKNIFRNLYIENHNSLRDSRKKIEIVLNEGVELIISEYVPGPDSNIFAYSCVRNPEGKILGEWVGRKLSQYPDSNGVFASASNEFNQEIKDQGSKLCKAINGFGFLEPEFKYDPRDRKYKLMEINLRPMMWHRVGFLNGVPLIKVIHDAYFYHQSEFSFKETKNKIHYVLMLHELMNIFFRKGGVINFLTIIKTADEIHWGIFDKSDMKPFLKSTILLFKRFLVRLIKRK